MLFDHNTKIHETNVCIIFQEKMSDLKYEGAFISLVPYQLK
jgi:hypothetical protein